MIFSNFVIINNALAWINFDEGRVIMDGTTVYFTETHIKDHLGNTRVAFGMQNNAMVVKQVNSYYPFGMNIKGLTTSNNALVTSAFPPNEYLYNGKMFQDELGLDWLDYGARMYDAVLGRWHVVDPLGEKFESFSPYSFALNNPILYLDPDGLEVKNGDEARKKEAEKKRDEAKNNRDNYNGDKESRPYKKLERKYNRSERNVTKATDKYNKTELAINDLKTHNRDLFNALNTLTDPGGQTVDVYIETVDNLQSNYYGDKYNGGTPVKTDGLSAMKPYKDFGTYWSVTSPFGHNTVAIALDSGLFDPGLVLSHEGGHTTYNLAFLKSYYIEWVIKRSNASKGGHGGGNPSGKEAERQEDIYRQNK